MSTQAPGWADRYGGARPDPAAVCDGQCEGTGAVPVWMHPEGGPRPFEVHAPEETDPELIAAWKAAEADQPSVSGWHFVNCPRCLGTGRKLAQ